MKRVFAVLLAFVMVVSFAACGKSSEKGTENEKNNSGNAVAGYVGIEANNDEGKIIAAADRTLFGSSGFAVEIIEDGDYISFEGGISFADILSMSGIFFEVGDFDTRVGLNDGKAYVVNDDYEEYFTLDIAKILSPSTGEFDALVTELTDHSVDEWIELLTQMGINVDFAKVAGWVKSIVKGSINEDVIAEIFDTVAIPYFVFCLNNNGFDSNLKVSDIPDFKTLKGIIYDFFLDGYASSALNIENNGDRYEVTVYYKDFITSAVDYLKNHEKLQNLVNSNIGQFVIEELEDEFDYFYDGEGFTFTVEITDGYISYVEFYDIEIRISDFNNVDTKGEYEGIVDDSKDYELIGEIKNLGDITAKI